MCYGQGSITANWLSSPENLPANPAWLLTEAVVSPLYRVGATLGSTGCAEPGKQGILMNSKCAYVVALLSAACILGLPAMSAAAQTKTDKAAPAKAAPR